MSKFSSLTLLSLFTLFSLSFVSCTKEIIKETIVKKDSIIVRTDSVIIKQQDVAKFMKKKWFLQSHEIEQYSSGILSNKKVENFVANAFYTEFKTGGAYSSFDLGGNNTGTWELLADNYYVLDKGTVNERYYYIMSISEAVLINRGPFTKNNQLLASFLFTAYFKSAQ